MLQEIRSNKETNSPGVRHDNEERLEYTWSTSGTEASKPRLHATFSASLSSHEFGSRRMARISASLGVRALGLRILQFELTAKALTGVWWRVPWISAGITPCYVRPDDSPIFKACEDCDLSRIRNLLELGQASIFDVQESKRLSLVGVSLLLRTYCLPYIFYMVSYVLCLQAMSWITNRQFYIRQFYSALLISPHFFHQQNPKNPSLASYRISLSKDRTLTFYRGREACMEYY